MRATSCWVIRRADNDNWRCRGRMDCGESIAETATEETGIDCEVTGLVGFRRILAK